MASRPPPSPEPEPRFARRQHALSAHLRDPAGAPAPAGLDAERLAIYSDAIFSNARRLIADNFPLVHRALGEERFLETVRDYLARHRSYTAPFPRVPLEFIDYLERERAAPADPPWLLELARYEWMETKLGADPREVDLAGIDRAGDLLEGVPVVNPVSELVRYDYPVHLLGAERPPAELERRATTLVLFRDLADAYGFLEVNPLAAQLYLALAANEGFSGRAILEAIAEQIAHPDPRVAVDGGLDIMRRLHARDVVLGTRDS